MKQLISDLKEGDRVESLFLVQEKASLAYKNKEGSFLHLRFRDRSGEIEARIWDDAEKYQNVCQAGDIAKVSGEVNCFRNALQINVIDISKAVPGETEGELFVANSSEDREKMKTELINLMHSVKPGPLQALANQFIHSSYFRLFCYAPAAKMYHHNVVGGLLEHSLGTARISLKLSELHPEIDRDLILIGSVLHDLGKIYEMEIDGGINYTDEGKLLGHIILGIQLLEKLMENIDMDNATKNKLLHMIASHHGQYEWQSPKKPQFLEAKVLHLADMMDAEIWKFKCASPSAEGSHWSGFMKSIGSEVYLGERESRLAGQYSSI